LRAFRLVFELGPYRSCRDLHEVELYGDTTARSWERDRWVPPAQKPSTSTRPRCRSGASAA